MRRAVALASLLALVLAAPAVAGAGVTVTGVDTSGYPQVRVTVVAPPGSPRPTLLENGQPAVGLGGVNLGQEKTVVLAIDRSESMRGVPLEQAAAAARALVAAKGPVDAVKVVAFGSDATALTGFSVTGADVNAALGEMTADTHPGTALWTAVERSADALAAQPGLGRVIVLVTDGRAVDDSTSFAEALAAAHRAHAIVYAVGIDGRGFDPAPLRDLAAETGGSFLQTSSSAGLASLYASIAKTLGGTWQLRYVTAARPGATIHLAAVVDGVGEATRAFSVPVASSTAADGAPAPLVSRSLWTSSLAPVVVALIVGLLVLAAVGFTLRTQRGSRLSARLAPHLGGAPRRPVRQKPEGRVLLRGLIDATERTLANVRQFQALQRLLTRADVPLQASELLYLCLGCGIGVAAVFAAAGAPSLAALVGTCAAAAIPLAWVGTKARKRMKAFDNQLPDILTTVAASLKAGHSFRHAIQAIVDEGVAPAANEFRRVLTETRLGRPMDDALAEMGERIGSRNLSFVLTSVTIQRQIGGSLAGLFDMVAETVRQRQQFARKVRALTATGRMSAYVLCGLPACMGALITVISPSYMAPLWHSSTGHVLVAVGGGMLVIGSLIIRGLVSFKG